LFGVIPTPEQIQLLNELNNRFERVILLFDADGAGITGGFSLSDWIPKIEFGSLPEGMHDAGEMAPAQIREFLNESSNEVGTKTDRCT
jgi:DNA primase